MRHSLDALAAFAHVAGAGSFSAAARQLNKGQSSISEAISNLEVDLNVTLFDRSQRLPRLTAAGVALLAQARQVLEANARLDRLAQSFSAGLEPRLTVALSDVYEWEGFETLLQVMDARYPGIEFECMVAESHDIVREVGQGRAHIGLLPAQRHYPADIVSEAVSEASDMALYIAADHPWAQVPSVSATDLATLRELRLNTFTVHDAPAAIRGQDEADPGKRKGTPWSAPNYLMLLEMAVLGFGWAALPTWMVQRYAVDKLHALNVPGWPKSVGIDAIWHAQRGVGAAGAWLLASVLKSSDGAPAARSSGYGLNAPSRPYTP